MFNIGSLFIVGFEGPRLTQDIEQKLLKIQPAGIILFDSNILSREQVRELIQSLRNLLGGELIITVDQEGGKVERLRRISPSLPSLWSLGHAGSKELLRSHSRILAEDMLDLGFNFVLAPCADLNRNPKNPIIGTRSLGTDADLVSEQLKVIISTYHDCGLQACVKHFPGHGSTSTDSHLSLPTLNLSGDEYAAELKPFTAAISEQVSAVLTAHVVFQNIDPQMPASLSHTILQHELRQKLNFDGLIITDDLGSMQAVKSFGKAGELSLKALAAGNNILLWHTDLNEPLSAINFTTSRAEQELLDHFNKSLSKIKALQSKLNKSFKPVSKDPNAEHQNMLEIVRRSANINKQKILSPRDLSQAIVLVFDHPKLEVPVIKSVFNLPVYQFSETRRAWTEASRNDALKPILIILSFQTSNYPGQKAFIKRLRAENQYEIIQVATDLEDEDAEIYLYGTNKIHLEALNQLLRIH